MSVAQLTTAPPALRALSVGHVHLSTPLAVNADRRPAVRKGDHLVVMGRSPVSRARPSRRGWRTAREPSWSSPVRSGRTTAEDLAGPGADEDNPDVRYWREEVEPLVDGRRVRWVGTVAGEERDELVATARVSLVPIDWEEPGGTAVVESLALGTPVVGFRRGCLPELIDDGRTGLLVDPGDEDALDAAVADAARLDPADCRPGRRGPVHARRGWRRATCERSAADVRSSAEARAAPDIRVQIRGAGLLDAHGRGPDDRVVGAPSAEMRVSS